MPDEIQIRIGTPADLDDMMDIAVNASDENGFVLATPEKILQEIYSALHQHNGMMGIIGIPGERAQGAVLLRVGEMWYSSSPVVEEKAIFVRPDFRKSRHASRLCKFSVYVADQLKLPLLIGVLSNHRTETKVRMYERILGKPAGAFWLVGANTGDTPAEKAA